MRFILVFSNVSRYSSACLQEHHYLKQITIIIGIHRDRKAVSPTGALNPALVSPQEKPVIYGRRLMSHDPTSETLPYLQAQDVAGGYRLYHYIFPKHFCFINVVLELTPQSITFGSWFFLPELRGFGCFPTWFIDFILFGTTILSATAVYHLFIIPDYYYCSRSSAPYTVPLRLALLSTVFRLLYSSWKGVHASRLDDHRWSTSLCMCSSYSWKLSW